MTHEMIEYIHIPKCGGTFIKNLLLNLDSDDSHDSSLTCKMYRKKHGDCTALHLSFEELRQRNANKMFLAVVRDPYSRLFSNYFYDMDTWRKIFGEIHCATFAAFVQFLYKNPLSIYKHIHLFPQAHFLLESRNSDRISRDVHIFSFKDLPMNVFYFMNQARIPMRKTNLFTKFNKQDIDFVVEPELIPLIKEIYKLDYKLLGNFF